MKDKPMTLKQAEEFLEKTDHPFSMITMRKAIRAKKLPATVVDDPIRHYTVQKDDLIAWASNTAYHKPGRVNWPGDPDDPMYKKG